MHTAFEYLDLAYQETVRKISELLRRIINFGVGKQLCQPLNWTIKLSKPDPDSERIEVLTDEQFKQLNEVWENYYDKHTVHLQQLITWTGSRPSEALNRYEKISMGTFTKRDTKSGKSLVFRMNQKVRAILQVQRALLDESVESMQTSQCDFLRPLGGQRKLDSFLRHFRRIRDFAGIPEDYRPNYCLRDTIATRLLSSGLYLDEVAHRLGQLLELR